MVNEAQSPYTVLARRFRPMSFAEVVGQEHVGQALQNAIRGGRVAHAYLFTGARGVGKTSTARIFAKALNCPAAVDGVPCNQCEVCQSIAAGSDVDVLEIDGASNRGIDDIRQLRANVGVRSMRSPNKVYIIDEVHMLTKEAFNALLKTLEEPPPNVKFVFCTTEPNKVPDTILSRCQRFDFGTIDQDSIANRLQQIAEAEGKIVDPDAVELVARRANGSMRDSQSLFDQLLAFGGEKITTEDVHRLLGTASDDRLIDLIEACISGQPGTALELVETALQQGVQTGGLTDQLLAYLRDLMVTAAGAHQVALSSVTDARRDQVRQQAERWGLQTISAGMQIVAETKSRLQRTTHGRALLELAVVRLASLERLDQISVLLQSGTAQAGGVMASPVANPAPKMTMRPPDSGAALKKNSEPPMTPQAATNRLPPEPEIISEPVSQVSFTESNLPDFWQSLLANVPDGLSGHLKNATRQAISGPNRLEILFPKSYLFSKQFCERAEPLKKLVSVAREMAGQAIECRFAVDHSAEVAVRTPSRVDRPALVERMKASAVETDPFVQQAVAIFGGQVVEVRPMREEAPAVEAVSEAEPADSQD
ncbi:DNA polymerase III subunit gamma/tau [Planctomicrobium piriforme]|uniref:DNA polymerase III subunit gamma/tau n=1 Tax=Planctomicrobium piriforme TaxID=1576369 RepID=A0A1I3C9Q2_9PLAN|nr:DNA polymerase III subunit gamma/tau [Planctomicrobium piriforme]SFH71300.1 DNA polymerase-3 subunit gamma/tau [Planctomicrobium piriforme]